MRLMDKKRKYGEVLALIPARGGSKSVPRKNILPLNGKPMIAWAIKTALDSLYISRVIVTTDDPEIAAVARKEGAEVPFLRPADISGDYATDIEYHLHAVGWLKECESYIPDMIVNLRPTPPSRDCAVIDKAIETFAAHPNADSLRSVHLASESPYKMWLIDEASAYLKPVAVLEGLKEPYNSPRQVLPMVYWQDGYVDITRPSVIMDMHSTTGERILPFIIENPAIDIDYHESIEGAEKQLLMQSHPCKYSFDEKDIRHPS